MTSGHSLEAQAKGNVASQRPIAQRQKAAMIAAQEPIYTRIDQGTDSLSAVSVEPPLLFSAI